MRAPLAGPLRHLARSPELRLGWALAGDEGRALERGAGHVVSDERAGLRLLGHVDGAPHVERDVVESRGVPLQLRQDVRERCADRHVLLVRRHDITVPCCAVPTETETDGVHVASSATGAATATPCWASATADAATTG